jgi:hypothetical protein
MFVRGRLGGRGWGSDKQAACSSIIQGCMPQQSLRPDAIDPRGGLLSSLKFVQSAHSDIELFVTNVEYKL